MSDIKALARRACACLSCESGFAAPAWMCKRAAIESALSEHGKALEAEIDGYNKIIAEIREYVMDSGVGVGAEYLHQALIRDHKRLSSERLSSDLAAADARWHASRREEAQAQLAEAQKTAEAADAVILSLEERNKGLLCKLEEAQRLLGRACIA